VQQQQQQQRVVLVVPLRPAQVLRLCPYAAHVWTPPAAAPHQATPPPL
jgi:hypothetical protein